MPRVTRRRIAGVVLALALAGALSASMASGVERVRGKGRKRPELAPSVSQRERIRARIDAREGAPSRAAARPEAMEPLASPVAPDAPGMSSHRGEREGRSSEAGVSPLHPHRAAGALGGPAPHEAAAPDAHAEAPGHGGPAVAGLTARIPAPMRVGWTVVEASAGRVRLVAEVERRRGFGAPVTVRLSLPPEASLLEGPERFTVPEGPGGDVRAVPYVISLGKGTPPTGDLVLVAHAEGASFGAHAEERYAFGREPSSQPRPVPTGPVLPGSLMRGDAPGVSGIEGEDPAP